MSHWEREKKTPNSVMKHEMLNVIEKPQTIAYVKHLGFKWNF